MFSRKGYLTGGLFSNRRMGLEEADWPHRERVYWFV
jgi:hypothetical protein